MGPDMSTSRSMLSRPSLPGKRARGDAHRKAKAVVAQVDLREGIDLPGDAAGEGDEAFPSTMDSCSCSSG